MKKSNGVRGGLKPRKIFIQLKPISLLYNILCPLEIKIYLGALIEISHYQIKHFGWVHVFLCPTDRAPMPANKFQIVLFKRLSKCNPSFINQ